MGIKEYIKGDLFLWALVVVLSIFSFLPVYSASTNLAYLHGGEGETASYLIRHGFHLGMGILVVYLTHKIPYNYFKALSVLALPVVILLLVFTAFQGNQISGANANRWLHIPIIGIGFQTSTLASVVLLAYVAKYLNGIKDKVITFKQSLLPLWLPVGIVLALILPANLSTTALIFGTVLLLCFIGGYPWKYLVSIIGVGIFMLTFFVLTAKALPGVFPNRVDTWVSRIETFMGDGNVDTMYQIDKAKTAISTGGVVGVGPGKSQQKYFLPQSSSDFIYAIIIEEYGATGGIAIVVVYMLVLFRLSIIAYKADTIFGTLVVVGVGFPIVLQALINMCVAVNILPVTGQTLPFISSGGTSIWMTALAIGIVLSVSAKREVLRTKALQEDEMNPLDILSEAL